MFSRAIEQVSPWTDRGMFDNINAPVFRESGAGSDGTMISTARALIARRIPEGQSFDVKLCNITQSSDASPAESLEGTIANNYSKIDDLKNMIVIVQNRQSITGGMDAEKFIEGLDQKFFSDHPGWEKAEKSDTFLNQYFKVRVMINKAQNAAILFTERLTMSFWHLLQSVFPTYVPMLFKDKPLDPKEKAVLKSLTMRGSNNYVREICNLEEFYDIRNKRIQALIGGFERRTREVQLEAIDNELANIRANMDRLMDQYRQQLEAQDNANIRRNGMVFAIDNANDDSELVSFFQANKAVDVISVSGTRITFVVRAALEPALFDCDAYETYRENKTFFDGMVCGGAFANWEDRRRFMDAMFMDRKFKIRLCGVYHLDIRGDLSTSSGYDYPANCSDFIPNYHLQHHGCLGDYRRKVIEYLQRGDTMGAVSSCIASAKTINIHETAATFNPFMVEVFKSTKKCIEFPDGTTMTPAEALEWLKKQEVAE